MSSLICPNCRAIVPRLLRCVRCGASFSRQAVNLHPAGPSEAAAAPPSSTGPARAPKSRSRVKIRRDLDPHLQNMICRMVWQDIQKPGTSSVEADEVAVIAKVTDVAAFEAIPGVRLGLVLPPMPEFDYPEALVTARIPVRISAEGSVTTVEEILDYPFVKSLKAAQRLRPSLGRVVSDMSPPAQPTVAAPEKVAPSDHDGGKGVVVGIIDFGLDFRHGNFRDEEGNTRILALWDQTAPRDFDGSFGSVSRFHYGRVYKRQDIDTVLKEFPDDSAGLADPAPYKRLGYTAPLHVEPGEKGTHATHIADIAVGNGDVTSQAGLAPRADIIFVEASTKVLGTLDPDALGDTFGDTAQLLEAVAFIFEEAGERPCVINISMGTNGGPHDGTTPVEEGIDRMLAQKKNRAVVIAAGNSFPDGIHVLNSHVSGKVEGGRPSDIKWKVFPGDSTNNELEIWYSGDDRFSIEIIDPAGKGKEKKIGKVEFGKNRLLKSGDRTMMFVANREKDRNNGDNVIALFVNKDMPPREWILRLEGEQVVDGRFHIWNERDEKGPTSFPDSRDTECTLASLSCGRRTIVVGSYNPDDSSLAPDTSSGKTRDGRKKPDVSAPGFQVNAARSCDNLSTEKSGTSMAAAAVTGVVALILAAAANSDTPVAAEDVRERLIAEARKDPPKESELEDGWHPRYGYGRVRNPFPSNDL